MFLIERLQKTQIPYAHMSTKSPHREHLSPVYTNKLPQISRENHIYNFNAYITISHIITLHILIYVY